MRGVEWIGRIAWRQMLGQQVRQRNFKTITFTCTQNQRPRPFIRPQCDVAGKRSEVSVRQRLEVRKRDNVSPQRIHHAIDVLRTKAIEHQRHIQCHDIRRDGATGNCRLGARTSK